MGIDKVVGVDRALSEVRFVVLSCQSRVESVVEALVEGEDITVRDGQLAEGYDHKVWALDLDERHELEHLECIDERPKETHGQPEGSSHNGGAANDSTSGSRNGAANELSLLL